MCGIVGAIGHHLDESELLRAIHALRHRGPDGHGTYFDPAADVALGHARLSIIDLAAGAQPLYSEDKDIVLVCNGEIYDFERIRADLIAKGHVFRTGSDSEVIIHLYQEHDTDFLRHLRGEFAFLLYDAGRQRLLAVRDRFGIKPLFFNEQAGKYLFASEAKALFATGKLKPEIDVVAVRDYLSGVIPESIFCGVQTVAPGHVLTVDIAGKSATQSQYWELNLPRNEVLRHNEGIADPAKAVREAVDEAIRLRMRADVPVGVYLSGGIDSAIVAAMASKYAQGPIKAFTIQFPDDSAFDELQIAKNMAEKIGADFHSVSCDRDTLLRDTEACLWITELPFGNFHSVGKFILSRLARQHVTVVLTGEGSDEVFLGYVYFQRGEGALSEQISYRLKRRKPVTGARVQALIDAVGFVPMPEHVRTFSKGHQRTVLGFFQKQHREKLQRVSPFERLIRRLPRKQTEGHTHARQVQYFWIKSMLAPYLLCLLGDRVEMAHSIEGRTPFLDHHLFELARNLPDEVKIHDGTEKYVLREAFKSDLTEELYRRKKWPYSAPPLRMVKGESAVLDVLLDKYLSSAALQSAGIFSPAGVALMKFLAKNIRVDSQFLRNIHIGLVLVLTVQILHYMYVQDFEGSLARIAEPTVPSPA